MGLALRPLGRPAPTQSLYRLRYPAYRYIILIAVDTKAFLSPVGLIRPTQPPSFSDSRLDLLVAQLFVAGRCFLDQFPPQLFFPLHVSVFQYQSRDPGRVQLHVQKYTSIIMLKIMCLRVTL
jgi:hypothetical protein